MDGDVADEEAHDLLTLFCRQTTVQTTLEVLHQIQVRMLILLAVIYVGQQC